jgi:hypothetical protein
MKGNRLLVLVACSLLASCAEPVTAPPDSEDLQPLFARGGRPFTPGEQQPTADLTRGFTYAIYPLGEGQNLAQTFSPQKNQKLGYLKLPVRCAPGVLLNVKIREGIGGAIMYEANVLGLFGPVDGTFELIQVYDPATSHGLRIRKNRTYAFELAAFPDPTIPNNPNRTCGMAPGPAGDSYARGQGYYEDVPTNGPEWLPLSAGGEDLPFITLVR